MASENIGVKERYVGKTYILLDVVQDLATNAAFTLSRSPGVGLVEILEGSPNLVFAVTAENRHRLASLTTAAISAVDDITGSVRLLPVNTEVDAAMCI
ncbi:hypothetical protein ABFB09_02990 [Dehalogenimonas sp. THU2]|uniref:hypothetical protein n=1 Tax=Dehalogenimonas sp. THU2 TaxID=3151121 RepID=UPI0032182193